ncbi:MAG: endonuclease domain-containing protein [Ruminococcus sp.]|nr:endonuclease domain-containing protein [Ruminococcus sp.]
MENKKIKEVSFSNSGLKSNSQTLRKNMTKEERHLWYDYLRDLPVGFKRQKPIGSYVADFYCYQAKLVIELDGSQHYDAGINADKDRTRDRYMESLGLTVMRFSNAEIHNHFRGVCESIHSYLSSLGLV